MKWIMVTTGACVMLAACGAENRDAPASPAAPAEAGTPATPRRAELPASTVSCAEPRQGVAAAVCADPQLVALDGELGRLHGLASAGPYAAQRSTDLDRWRSEFDSARQACGNNADTRACLTAAYGQGVADIRTAFSDARSADDAGFSDGPTPVRCQGQEALITTTFVNTDPGVVVLQWLTNTAVLTKTQSGSGARYTGSLNGQPTTFWTQGEEARFDPPGPAGELACAFEAAG